MKRIAIALMATTAMALTVNYASSQAVQGRADEWPTYGHDKGGMRYSPLTQITPANVSRLKVAWTYHMKPGGAEAVAAAAPAAGRGGAGGGFGQAGRGNVTVGGGVGGLFGDPATPNNGRPAVPGMQQGEQTPLVINGVMYTSTPYGRIVALDPQTGKEVWVYTIPNGGNVGRGRGIEYWEGDAQNAPRIYTHSSYGGIIALDAKTGKPVSSFGVGGMLAAGSVGSSNSPPIIVGNVIVSQGANPNKEDGQGDVRGFDVRTGKQVWTFHSVPRPGEKNYGTWPSPDSYRSGAHMWGLLTADVPRDIVYLTFTAPNNNRFGGERPGNNLYSTSMVAVKASTGAYLWHFQLVHHDVWDADMQAPPMLFDVKRNGQTIPAVAAVNKMSLLFILNRVTGEHIYKIEERPVPQSVNPDEKTSPTQPYPLEIPPLARQSITPNQLANLTPQHSAFCKKFIEDNKIKLEGGPYLPAGYKYPTVQFPGTIGGVNWGGMSFNPELGYLFVNTMDLGQVQGLDLAPPGSGRGGGGGRGGAGAGGGADVDDDPNAVAAYSFMQPFGRFKEANSNMMCNAPPWGRLIAVNANTGKFAWEVTLGVTDDLPAAIRNTGRPNLGGSIATASGLVFIGATDDRRFRAFDARTGKMLWETMMPAVAQSVPITYQNKGKQYVAVTATGGGFMQMPLESDTITAFTLP
jgi:quinoprotein glucose dehydrogenase